MSSQPNNNSGNSSSTTLGRAIGFLALIALVIYLASHQSAPQSSSNSAPSRPGPVARSVDADNAPVVNPLENELHPHDSGERSDGVAAAILVDTSGSMGETVPDLAGGSSPKIAIARRAVVNLVRRSADFARAHPDQKIQVGIFEFSGLDHQPACRTVLPLAAPDLARAQTAVTTMTPNGGTPIGDAIVEAKKSLDASKLRRLHILVVTDGENNRGYAPAEVVSAIARLDEPYRASVYFIAFDVAAAKFNDVRNAGGLVLPAANESELQKTLDYVLEGKILAEQVPVPPGK